MLEPFNPSIKLYLLLSSCLLFLLLIKNKIIKRDQIMTTARAATIGMMISIKLVLVSCAVAAAKSVVCLLSATDPVGRDSLSLLVDPFSAFMFSTMCNHTDLLQYWYLQLFLSLLMMNQKILEE